LPARSITRFVALSAVVALSLTACANNSDSGSGGGGGGSKDLIISTDLPLQGSSATQSDDTNKLIQLYLDQIGGKAGDYNIKLKTYDDATAAAGKWDPAACAKNATDHVATENEVAVMGTFNSGCAKIEVPTLNQDSTGPMLVVSHANTNVGTLRTVLWGRIAAASIMATVALAATPDGVRIITAAAAGAGVWATYHALRERRGGVVGNQPFEWPRLLVWVAVCVTMIPVGGLIGLALVVFMILALAEFMPTM